jgi:hypothetical protein
MNLDISTLGHPTGDGRRHHRLRMALSIAAGIAGAIAMMGIVFLAIGTISPGQAAIAYVAIVILLVVWISGIWWRWDSPDVRSPEHERERRGF